jgi:hypothetical protein
LIYKKNLENTKEAWSGFFLYQMVRRTGKGIGLVWQSKIAGKKPTAPG